MMTIPKDLRPTPRMNLCLELIQRGLSRTQVAAEMRISKGSVNSMLTRAKELNGGSLPVGPMPDISVTGRCKACHLALPCDPCVRGDATKGMGTWNW